MGYGIVVGLVNVFDASSDCGSDQRTSTIYGLQLAGAVNYSGAWYGIQVGPVNVTISPEKPSDRYPRRNPSWGHGLQLGMVNVGAIKGLQVGLWNDGMQGAMVQVGIVNRARRVTGLQLGVVNISDELRGMQLGLVNVARTASIPVTVLVNADF